MNPVNAYRHGPGWHRHLGNGKHMDGPNPYGGSLHQWNDESVVELQIPRCYILHCPFSFISSIRRLFLFLDSFFFATLNSLDLLIKLGLLHRCIIIL